MRPFLFLNNLKQAVNVQSIAIAKFSQKADMDTDTAHGTQHTRRGEKEATSQAEHYLYLSLFTRYNAVLVLIAYTVIQLYTHTLTTVSYCSVSFSQTDTAQRTVYERSAQPRSHSLSRSVTIS